MSKEWVKKEAKEEQKKRMEEQVESVRKKLTKWADKVIVGGFYTKENIKREEGDTWEDAEGRTWTIKNGIKQTISHFENYRTPWWCPRCGHPLNHKIHEKFWRIRGACHNCVVKYETKMRIDKVWPAYERRTMRNNEKAWIRDKIQEHQSYISGFKVPQLHFGDGRWEELAQLNQFKELFSTLEKDIKFLEDRLKQIEKEELEDADEQRKLTEWETVNPWS